MLFCLHSLVLGHFLLLEGHNFSRASLSEQITFVDKLTLVHIYAPNVGFCSYKLVAQGTENSHKVAPPVNGQHSRVNSHSLLYYWIYPITDNSDNQEVTSKPIGFMKLCHRQRILKCFIKFVINVVYFPFITITIRSQIFVVDQMFF